MANVIDQVLADLENLKAQFNHDISASDEQVPLQDIRIKYLGKKGLLAQFYKLLSSAAQEERPVLGQHINAAKHYVESKIAGLAQLQSQKQSGATGEDVTLPGVRPHIGRSNLLIQVLEEIKAIFRGMGFTVESGPEAETDYYNFEALNIPEDHPSRELQDTFYLPGGLLLRTHTSPVQIRTMEQFSPPIRMIAPGRCFRKDTPDATHSPIFHQTEGLVVDEGVSFADLKGVLLSFIRKMFGPQVRIRFRPSFFPFTEPSAEYDISCIMCEGKGCRICKNSGWIEISGAGMVDPAVFNFVGYDAEKYTGYAFGMGAERIAMLKYGIGDIRAFYENDLRFLRQF